MSQERKENTVPVENTDTTQKEKANIAWQMYRREAMQRMKEYNSPAKVMGRNLLFGGE